MGLATTRKRHCMENQARIKVQRDLWVALDWIGPGVAGDGLGATQYAWKWITVGKHSRYLPRYRGTWFTKYTYGYKERLFNRHFPRPIH
ncbi:hypothetical protein CGRA01v4_11453 [Colletotrichum graminicola]|nr:hypothetical protein CGRA01v4_11453 [Colletotrichum graminicola]